MIILCTLLVLVVAYICLNVIQLARKNRKAHQFFKIYAPDLPVLDKPKLFSGHMLDVLMQPKNWKVVDDLHKRLGPSFGLFYCNQPWIVTKDVDLIRKVHIEQGNLHINRTFLGFPMEEFNKSILEVTDDDWRRARQAVAVPLAKHKVSQEEITDDFSLCVKQFHDVLENKLNQAEAKTGERILIIEDTHNLFERFSLAVILLAAYKQENVVDFYADRDPWVELIRNSLDSSTTPLLSLAILFPFIRPILTFLVKYHPLGKMPDKLLNLLLKNISLNKKARNYHEKLQSHVDRNKAAGDSSFSSVKSQGDFKRRLADSLIDSHFEKKITYTDLKSNLLMLVLVGFETTANTGTLLLFLLAKHPKIQQKLREELKLYGAKSDYFEWCFWETIRYQSVVPFGGGRILKEDVTVQHNGRTYPKGAYIIPSTYSIHHDPNYWPNPESFLPERWNSKTNFLSSPAMLGFGVGPRNCPGYQFALQELAFVLEMILRNYQLETCEDTVKEYRFSSPATFYSLFDDKIKLKLVPSVTRAE